LENIEKAKPQGSKPFRGKGGIQNHNKGEKHKKHPKEKCGLVSRAGSGILTLGGRG